jgi:hypothetical protein
MLGETLEWPSTKIQGIECKKSTLGTRMRELSMNIIDAPLTWAAFAARGKRRMLFSIVGIAAAE